MENKQDIGKAFKDRLDGLHREPGDAVWQNISASLQQQKRGGFRMPFWGKATSILVGVVAVAVFTHSYWEPYMPEIIIKMPGEKEQQTVTATNGSATTPPSATKSHSNSNTQSTGATPRSQGGANATTPVTDNAGNTINTPGTATKSGNTATQPNTTTGSSAVAYGTKGVSGSKGSGTTATALASDKKTGLNRSTVKNQHNTGSSTASAYKTTGVKAPQNTVSTAASSAKTPKATQGTATKATTVAIAKNNTGAVGNVSGTTVHPAENAVANTNTTAVNATSGLAGATTGTQTQLATQQTVSGSATPTTTGAAATSKPSYNKIDPKVYDNVLYSAGNFPTVTKGFVDSLVRVQNILDEKKRRERSFAKPVYALQDSLGGGKGNRNDFYVFGFIAPTNYKFGKTTSVIDPSLNSHRSSAETSNNFGAYLGYEFTSQFSVRAGITRVKITNRTRNVTLGADYSGVDYANGMSNTAANIALGNSPVTLRQETSFIEVPLEATYAMFGTRADLYFKGGVSMFFMGDNELYATNSQGTVLMGSLNRAKDFSLAGNAGFGFYYKFLRELQLNVEPGLKYYFNTFEDANPFSLYVQAGLLYRF